MAVNYQGLKVVHLGKYYPPAPGGIESHVQTLARAQAALGMDVRVICMNHANRAGRDITWARYGATQSVEEHDGLVKVHRVGRSASVARLDMCPELPHLLRRVEREGADVLHLHTPNPMMLIAMAMARPATPLIITHHSDIVRQRILKYALRPFERFVYNRACQIKATSPKYIEGSSLLRHYGSQVGTLPLGVDLDKYLIPTPDTLRHEAALRNELHGEPLWLCVGRCVYYKNFDIAIHALAHVPGRLMIIGHGPLRENLQRLAKSLGVQDRVIWRNYVDADELAGAYRAAAALWFPSGARSEGFGLVQVESMASGCPVINANIAGSGVAWVSENDHTGLTIPVGDASALAHAAMRLVNEPGLRDRLGVAARRRACAEFDHMTMARRSGDAYQHAIAGETILHLPAAKAASPPAEPRRPKTHSNRLLELETHFADHVDEEDSSLAM
jgi:rhamnosyl/mannosyltransferase